MWPGARRDGEGTRGVMPWVKDRKPRWLPSIPASLSSGLHWREVEDRRDGEGTTTLAT